MKNLIVVSPAPQKIRRADVTGQTFWYAGSCFLTETDRIGFYLPVTGRESRPFGNDVMVWVGKAEDASRNDSTKAEQNWAAGYTRDKR